MEILKKTLLGEYLIGFLEFFGINFDLNSQEIYMDEGGFIRNKECKNNLSFSVLFEAEEGNNLGYQAYRIREIFSVFRNRYYFIKNLEFDDNEDSILKYLINPSETNFLKYL